MSFIYMTQNMNASNIDNNTININEKQTVVNIIEDENNRLEKRKDSIKSELLDEVISYIKKQSPKSNTNLPYYIVEHALDKDFDICFMLGQTQIETNFGTVGIGKKSSRKSLFGVYKTYKNYDACIKDYIRIVQNNYLGNKKTHHNLLKNYVTLRGARYAENPKYEQTLRKTYYNIKRHTNIDTLQKEYNECT